MVKAIRGAATVDMCGPHSLPPVSTDALTAVRTTLLCSRWFGCRTRGWTFRPGWPKQPILEPWGCLNVPPAWPIGVLSS